MRLWGQVGDNEVRRKLSKSDIRTLKSGGEVRTKVNGLIVVLVAEHAISPEQKRIDRINARIAKLEAKKEELMK
jgi:hypothetical protein